MKRLDLLELKKDIHKIGWQKCLEYPKNHSTSRKRKWKFRVAVAIAECVIFEDSEILDTIFGGDIEDIIRSFSFSDTEKRYIPTLGGKVWWKDLKNKNGY